MRGNNRKSIEKCRKRLPQFTTMNVIDGQAGLVIYSSLIFYSLTIYNILNIIVLLILAGISIAMLTGENGILTQASKSKEETEQGKVEEMVSVAIGGLRAEYLGDKGQITPQKIAEQVNKDNNRTDVTASSSTFPTNINFEEEGLKVPVDMNLNVGNSETNNPEELPLYSADIDESQIAPAELFDFEIIQETASNTKIATVGNISGLPQKEARIKKIKPEYCNEHGYNPDTSNNDFTDTNYEIKYEGITDTLIIPYQVEINGEMYKITEVNLTVENAKDNGTSLPSIENIIYPNTVKRILYEANSNGLQYGSNIDRVKKVVLSENLTSIPEYFFSKGKIEQIHIPSSVTSIGPRAFQNCTSLKSINIPSSVTSIEEEVFSGCCQLKSIQIPSGVTSIGREAFYRCILLTSVNIPASVTNIGGFAFLNCDALTTINIAKPENSIDGAPWNAPQTTTINWNYQGK